METVELKPTTPPAAPVPPSPPSSTTPPATSVSAPKVGKVVQVTVGGYWINHYRKRCHQATTDYCNRLVLGFATTMASFGHKIGMIRSEDKAFPDQWSAWADTKPGGVDTVEFSYLATHGGTYGHELKASTTGSNWIHWFMATFDNLNANNGCHISTLKLQWDPDPKVKNWILKAPTNPTPMMVLGDGRLRWAVIDCCRSLQVRLENDSNRNPDYETEDQFNERVKQVAEATPDRTWRWCLDGVHMLFGFTGYSSDSGLTAQRGTSFAQRAGKGETLAESWLDEAYSHWCEDAPVVLACGRSGEDSQRRLETESLATTSPTLRASDIGGYTYMWRS